MGMGGGGGRGKVKSDINVTPLVDVVLVLLIIFIVAIPIMMKEITLEIPKKADEDEVIDRPSDQITLKLRVDTMVEFQTGFGAAEPIARTDVAKKLHDKLEQQLEKDRVVFVDFEEGVQYGDAVSLMDTVKGAGAKMIGLKMKQEGSPQTAPQ